MNAQARLNRTLQVNELLQSTARTKKPLLIETRRGL